MYRICFLIPFYNHPYRIKELCKILNFYKFCVLIVDDGSNEQAKKELEGLKANIIVLKQNSGKGAAVKEGILWCAKNGYTHAFQIDADMQHDMKKIPEFLEVVKSKPDTLVCGYGKYDKSAPKLRLYGRKITDFWVWINTFGGKFKDAMTGMRVYPIRQTLEILDITTANRMDFDIDILLNLYKNGCKIHWIQVEVNYGAISHFRGLKDNLLISKIHAKHFFALPKFILKRLKSVK